MGGALEDTSKLGRREHRRDECADRDGRSRGPSSRAPVRQCCTDAGEEPPCVDGVDPAAERPPRTGTSSPGSDPLGGDRRWRAHLAEEEQRDRDRSRAEVASRHDLTRDDRHDGATASAAVPPYVHDARVRRGCRVRRAPQLPTPETVPDQAERLARHPARPTATRARPRAGAVDRRWLGDPEVDVARGMNDDMRAPSFHCVRSTTRGARANETLASPFLWADGRCRCVRLLGACYPHADGVAQSSSVMVEDLPRAPPTLTQPARGVVPKDQQGRALTAQCRRSGRTSSRRTRRSSSAALGASRGLLISSNSPS